MEKIVFASDNRHKTAEAAELPLSDNFYDDNLPLLTAQKCVKPEIKRVYKNILKNKVRTAVLCWEHDPTKIPSVIKNCEPIITDAAWQTYLWNKKVLFVMLRIGAPIAAAAIEELKIYGVKTFLAAGTAGCIDKDFDESQVITVNRAIRDEGTSYHYLRPSLYADLDENLADKISNFLTYKGVKNIKGTTWTTDAFYRETPNRIKKRIGQGALAVEMECAALAAAAKFNGLDFGQILWFSDKVGDDWTWLDTTETRNSLKEKMLQIMLEFAAAV